MVKNKKILKIGALVLFTLLFVTFTVFAFFVPSTASAFETTTYYNTNTYIDYTPLYQVTGNNLEPVYNFNNYISMWHMRFEFFDNIPVFFMYFLDHNYNQDATSIELDYTNEYVLNGTVKAAKTLTGSTSYRWFDYVAVLHEYSSPMIEKTLPEYLKITYTALDSTSYVATYDWTAKRSTGYPYVLVTYSFGNSDYAFDITFCVLVNSDFIDMKLSNPAKLYSYTMYFGTNNNANGDGSYVAGYNAGYEAGKNASANTAFNDGYQKGNEYGYEQGKLDADSTVNKDSASYQQGVTDALAENNPYTFSSLFGSIADSQLGFINGLLGFNFLGVNMLSLFKFLITLGLTFCILRMLKG